MSDASHPFCLKCEQPDYACECDDPDFLEPRVKQIMDRTDHGAALDERVKHFLQAQPADQANESGNLSDRRPLA
jgi:hypothetical protein